MRNPFLKKLNPSTYQMILNQATAKKFSLNSISSNPAGPIDKARRKPGSEKQKSLPLPFKINGRRKTFLMRLNPISL
jgi:hypothetical protein